MTEDEKAEELGKSLDAAIAHIVTKSVEFNFDPITVAQASVTIPFSLLFGLCPPGKEREMEPMVTGLVIEAAKLVGAHTKKAAKAAEDAKNAAINAAAESEPYDGPLTANDVPEQIRKELHEFFNSKKD
tara:strand:- start:87 stop:473 length:387 start_codon:yes stop_codon:yes gene_type:complete